MLPDIVTVMVQINNALHAQTFLVLVLDIPSGGTLCV